LLFLLLLWFSRSGNGLVDFVYVEERRTGAAADLELLTVLVAYRPTQQQGAPFFNLVL
jgi:hypothetical protein